MSAMESLVQQVRNLEAEVTRLAQEIQRSQQEAKALRCNLRHARAHLIATRESVRAQESPEMTLAIVEVGLEGPRE